MDVIYSNNPILDSEVSGTFRRSGEKEMASGTGSPGA
jgi:hypothetical protein